MLFESERLTYRNLTGDDKDFYCTLYSDDELMRFIEIDNAYSKVEDYFENTLKAINKPKPKYKLLVIEQKQSSIPLGVMGIDNIDYSQSTADLGIILTRHAQGKNIPYEATMATLKYIFDTLNIQHVSTSFQIMNKPILRLVERIGFSRVQKTDKSQNAPHFTYTISKQRL
jgi:RimJ/RimL family protein N-acetyltransferase